MIFILASRSPQRREILTDLRIDFEVIPSSYDESLCTETDPAARAVMLAEEKAMNVFQRLPGLPAVVPVGEGWVIGVDTLVVSADGQLMEKPIDADDARRMLRLHSGTTSIVHSGICLVCFSRHPERLPAVAKAKAGSRRGKEKRIVNNEECECHTALSSAYVTFKELSDQVIEEWIESGMWKERSGGFQIDIFEDSKMPNSKTPSKIKNNKFENSKDLSGHPLIASLDGEFETVVGFPVTEFQKIIDQISSN